MAGSSCTKLLRADWAKAAAAMALLVAALALGACATNPNPEPPQVAAAEPAPPPPPPPPSPPPVELGGKWKLAAASGGGCLMTFGQTAGATEGSIAPAGGCPGKFFTSRKWTFEHDMLIVRNHKGEALAQLSFSGGHFEGQGPNGAGLTLSR